jgi:FtsP/CotA-like multicopper oxidase with cupredoxin domain
MGDVITVNGVAWPKMKVAQGRYRFRMVNGSISRSYRLGLSTGDPIYVIGTDAGLKQKVAPTTGEFRVGMAERYDFIIDFSKYKDGSQIVLQNLELPINIEYDNTNLVMRFDVDASLNNASPLSQTPRD